MQYRDYYLNSYEVADGGKKITLNLVSEQNGGDKQTAQIIFSDVTLYNFIHTSGAVITDIREESVSELVNGFKISLVQWNQRCGINDWNDNVDHYGLMLINLGYKGWVIESSAGFHGFIIAKSMQ